MIIALCSPAMGSGKSTIADHLVARRGFVKVSFATPLKAMCLALLQSIPHEPGEPEDRIYGHRKEEVIPLLGITSRRLQQLAGTEFGRNLIKDSLWVDIAMEQCRRFQNVVIDDMRFRNEYDAVLAAGGQVWRVRRPGAVVTAGHVSEGALDDIAMPEILNNGSVWDLYTDIDLLLTWASRKG